jgi:hypothetical protein
MAPKLVKECTAADCSFSTTLSCFAQCVVHGTGPLQYEFMPCHIVGKSIQHYPLIYNEDIF